MYAYAVILQTAVFIEVDLLTVVISYIIS